MALAQQPGTTGNNLLACRQQPLNAENPQITLYLTEYGKSRVQELKDGQTIKPELVRRMKMLVNQEFRILDTCKKFTEACEDIIVSCDQSQTVPDNELQEMLAEVADYYSDLSDFKRQRQDNINVILEDEKEGLKRFQQLHDDIDSEKKAVGVISAAPAVALLATAAAISCPVTLVGGILMGVLGGMTAAEHAERANKVQAALDQDIQAKNMPIQSLG